MPDAAGGVVLDEERLQDALGRFAVVRSHLQDGVALSAAAAQAGMSARTARRWLARYRSGGLAALARPSRSDRGRRRTPAVLVELIEGLALQRPAPPIAFTHRRVVDVAREHGWTAPSYAAVHAVLRALDPGLVVLAHDGPVRYRERFELVYRREASAPNEIWQADHTQLDILIIDEHGRAVRPWLTVIEDDHSRAIAGYVVFVRAPSALQTALALRQAIWRKSAPRMGGMRHPGDPVLRSRLGLHQPPHRRGLRRPARPTGALDGRGAPGPRQARAAVRHDHQRAALRPARLTGTRIGEARHGAGAVAPRARRRDRPVPRRGLQPACALRDQGHARPALDRRRLATADARIPGAAGHAAATRRAPARGAPRRHPI